MCVRVFSVGFGPGLDSMSVLNVCTSVAWFAEHPMLVVLH